jgi:radical SAM superfamily enzyme YgiQ (UPF0313 family)
MTTTSAVAGRQLDALFINPDSSTQAYQGLAHTYAAIETPTWSLLLAQSCRAKGFGVAILDCDAERLSLQDAARRVQEAGARLVVFVVYGQNPNSGTTSMIGATALAEAVKQQSPGTPIAFVGSYTSALPKAVLALPYVDIVLLNEGVYALHNLLRGNLTTDLASVAGIGYKKRDASGGAPLLWLNPPQGVVPQERMDEDLPGYAWDLLPYRNKPLDLYRAHFWHAGYDHERRTPFAAIYTSLGCNFGCDFCMINIVNRVDNANGVVSAQSRGMRFWSAGLIANEMQKLAAMGCTMLRISDEMFFLNRRWYEPLLQQVIDRDLHFNMWAYSRVDSVRADALDQFRRAGISWIALGVEAGNQQVRQEISKGSFKDVNVRNVCATIREAGFNVSTNFIFGFPDDTRETMQQTLDLALELNTEMVNMYPCQALPGSPIHQKALAKGWQLPDSYAGYAFLSYECQPLATLHVGAAEVLRFRDEAWHTYHTQPAYLELVERRFGVRQRANVEAMSKIRLKRRLLGDPPP